MLFKVLFHNLKEQCLPFVSPLFKKFIVYTPLKPHSEVPHYSSGHFRWFAAISCWIAAFSLSDVLGLRL
jgi:hypothetical protein